MIATVLSWAGAVLGMGVLTLMAVSRPLAESPLSDAARLD